MNISFHCIRQHIIFLQKGGRTNSTCLRVVGIISSPGIGLGSALGAAGLGAGATALGAGAGTGAGTLDPFFPAATLAISFSSNCLSMSSSEAFRVERETRSRTVQACPANEDLWLTARVLRIGAGT